MDSERGQGGLGGDSRDSEFRGRRTVKTEDIEERTAVKMSLVSGRSIVLVYYGLFLGGIQVQT